MVQRRGNRGGSIGGYKKCCKVRAVHSSIFRFIFHLFFHSIFFVKNNIKNKSRNDHITKNRQDSCRILPFFGRLSLRISVSASSFKSHLLPSTSSHVFQVACLTGWIGTRKTAIAYSPTQQLPLKKKDGPPPLLRVPRTAIMVQ